MSLYHICEWSSNHLKIEKQETNDLEEGRHLTLGIGDAVKES